MLELDRLFGQFALEHQPARSKEQLVID